MPSDAHKARVIATEFVLLQWCIEHHARLSGDKAVNEANAGRLIGRSGRTLARRIAEGRPVPRHRIDADGRRFYRLSDLAEWLEAGYHDDDD